ncbi:MAG: DUF3572 domain-containing protein [Pseudomonadota bacterium]
MPLSGDAAETVALQALGWLASQDEMVGAFLASTGASSTELAERARDPEFLGFVLDFMLQDEEGLTAFCVAAGIAPDVPMRARAGLPGGDLPNWT